jgi:cytochrome c553
VPSFRLGPARTSALLAGVLATWSCAGGPAPAETTGNHMFEHFGRADEIQSALILGEVEATRGPARWLATHRGEGIPDEGRESFEMMRTEARVIEHQTDLKELGRALGRMGVACGSCHEATGGGPKISLDAAAPHSGRGPEHMLRHAWALDRLWEGLFAPSDGAWEAGAAALMDMPSDFGSNDQANRLAKRVHALSQQARSASTSRQRVETYAEAIQTCALCHGALGLRLH